MLAFIILPLLPTSSYRRVSISPQVEPHPQEVSALTSTLWVIRHFITQQNSIMSGFCKFFWTITLINVTTSYIQHILLFILPEWVKHWRQLIYYSMKQSPTSLHLFGDRVIFLSAFAYSPLSKMVPCRFYSVTDWHSRMPQDLFGVVGEKQVPDRGSQVQLEVGCMSFVYYLGQHCLFLDDQCLPNSIPRLS